MHAVIELGNNIDLIIYQLILQCISNILFNAYILFSHDIASGGRLHLYSEPIYHVDTPFLGSKARLNAIMC